MTKSDMKRMLRSIKSNCRARRKTCDLTLQDVADLWGECGGKCVLTGIEFNLDPYAGKRRPFAPSIDRIDPLRGYSRANCRFVCTAVNYAMSDWGLAVLRRIAVALLENDPSDYVPGGRLLGVVTRNQRGKTVFESCISTARGRIYLGRFPTAWDAHSAYKKALATVRAGGQILKRREARKSIKINSDFPMESRHVA